MTSIRTVLAATALALFINGPASTAELGVPSGEIVLSVSGDLSMTNADGAALFDIAMLEELGSTSFSTETPWTDGVQAFEGVSLMALMAALGVSDGTLKATAINDYAVDIPVADAVEGGPIISFRRNGEAMSVRDKGPLWVVYPYDLNEAYQTEVIYSRSIWQLDRIEINP